ncbi:CS1 type fimbrial major subunit [Pantoea ananatis]|uniref:CS1 type fimbrial major subunit n=1 Tax=Pantoea ananas TaxID=553 RepID=UPI003FA44679
MKNNLKFICLSAMLASAASQAYQADITVQATIDPTAGITLANGDSLTAKPVEMNYNPQTGLDPYKADVKIWSNADHDMNVRLANSAQLTDASGTNPIPLAVTLNNVQLGVTDTVYQYKDLFPSDSLANGSVPLPLVIKQENQGKLSVTGRFSGTVSLIVSQATTKNGSAVTPSP